MQENVGTKQLRLDEMISKNIASENARTSLEEEGDSNDDSDEAVCDLCKLELLI